MYISPDEVQDVEESVPTHELLSHGDMAINETTNDKHWDRIRSSDDDKIHSSAQRT